MKKLAVCVAGTGVVRDIEINPGTTATDVLRSLHLSDRKLGKVRDDQFFADTQSLYENVVHGETIFASIHPA